MSLMGGGNSFDPLVPISHLFVVAPSSRSRVIQPRESAGDNVPLSSVRREEKIQAVHFIAASANNTASRDGRRRPIFVPESYPPFSPVKPPSIFDNFVDI